MTLHGAICCARAKKKLSVAKSKSPHAMLTRTAVVSGRTSTGTTKVSAMISFAKNVAMVASQICIVGPLFFDSSARWMPSASDMASATAIVRIPPITIARECVPECNPTIRPSVVITPDVRPKLNPVFQDDFILPLARLIAERSEHKPGRPGWPLPTWLISKHPWRYSAVPHECS